MPVVELSPDEQVIPIAQPLGEGEEVFPLKPQIPEPQSAQRPSPREIGERAEGTFTGTIAQGLRLADEPRQAPLDIALERGGISAEGAPAAARLVEGFAINNTEALKGVKIGLEKAFGKEVEIRIGPETGRMEFKNPITGQITLVNPPGVDLGDLFSLAGEGVVAAPEIAGAIGGSFVSPVVGTALGAGAGAFVGEVWRLRLGQRMGVNTDMTDDDLVREAIFRAGIATVAGPVFERALKLGQIILSRIPAPLAKRQATSKAAKEAEVLSKDVESITGESFPQTAGQALRDDELLTTEKIVAVRDKGSPLRETFDEQGQQLQKLEDNIKAPFENPRTTERVGEDIQRVVRRGPIKGQEKIEARTEVVRQDAIDSAAVATRGEVTPMQAASLARESLQKGNNAVRDSFRKDYAELNRAAGDARIDLTLFRRVANKWKKTLDDDILPSLVEEDRLLISEAARAKTRQVEGLEFGPTVEGGRLLQPVTRTETDPASFGSVQRSLSALRDELRAARKGVSARKDIKALTQLHDALLRSRNKALKGHPELRAKVDGIEAAYARKKELVDRSLIGEILSKKEGGGYKLADEKIIPLILGSPSGARQISLALSDPKFASFKDALKPIRQGILGDYNLKVIDPETGIANLAKHRTWIGQKLPVLKEFFTQGEIKTLNRPGQAVVMLRAAERKEKEVVARLNRSFGMKLNSYDSSEVVNKTWNPGKLETARRVRRMLKDDPDKWQGYQGAALRKFWADISTYDSQREAFAVSLPKLEAKLNDQSMVTLLRETFGTKHVVNLRILSNALKVANREAQQNQTGLASSILDIGRGSALRHIARAGVGMFTIQGRLMTAGIRIRGKAAERAVTKALSDINELDRLVQLRHVSPNSEKARTILGSFSATILAGPSADEQQLRQPQ